MRTSSFLAGLALLALSGCAGVVDVDRRAPQKMAVAEAGLVIAGPPGYCIDPTSSRTEAGGGAFVLLGSCASITQNADQPKPATPGVLTVTVAGTQTADAVIPQRLDYLAEYFRTERGRAALSRTGDPTNVQVLDVRSAGDTLIIRARDRAAPEDGLAPDMFRALFGLNNRLLSVTVSGFEDLPLTANDGYDILDTLTDRIRAENAG